MVDGDSEVPKVAQRWNYYTQTQQACQKSPKELPKHCGALLEVLLHYTRLVVCLGGIPTPVVCHHVQSNWALMMHWRPELTKALVAPAKGEVLVDGSN